MLGFHHAGLVEQRKRGGRYGAGHLLLNGRQGVGNLLQARDVHRRCLGGVGALETHAALHLATRQAGTQRFAQQRLQVTQAFVQTKMRLQVALVHRTYLDLQGAKGAACSARAKAVML